MKTTLMSLAVTVVAASSLGLLAPALADSYTSVTTTTTETPMSSYSYRRTIIPMASPKMTEKSVTVTRSAVVKRSCARTHAAYVRHPRHIASSYHTRRPFIASSTTTKTITRTIEKPVVIEKVVRKPVYVDRFVDRPVYRDRIVERPVVINRSVVEESPVLIKEKVTHHSDHDTINIKRYF